ncbi:hypothetical protein GCM10011391_17580 [Pullulanibacillus camelliae]|uniref:Glycosyltransferase 2-like domain-containing protein n=1 Tax=Pullulanibacillus camelliae TaxID=1707096 RepID=A0A8J2YH06_9BACL|nr:methyltransferase domain-containing protein [Pullulanibacillus camelliae]GGE39289.1 hypothetical protein GCM10011391_17580 [Pullulanibacillus camelliae]
MNKNYNQASFNASYYETGLGPIPYDRKAGEGHWLHFFSNVADRIIKELEVKRTLEVGCAKGFLVESLRDRGIEANGFDISEYAISEVREDIEPFCKVGSADDPDQYHGTYDLIICIEVLEHVTADMAKRAIELMCRHSARILFSSSPDDFEEATHINVHPPNYWDRLFATQGFLRSFSSWPSEAVAGHTVLYERADQMEDERKATIDLEGALRRLQDIYPIKGQEKQIPVVNMQLTQELISLLKKKEQLNKERDFYKKQSALLETWKAETEHSEQDVYTPLKQNLQKRDDQLLKEIDHLHHILNAVNSKLIECRRMMDTAQYLWEEGKNHWLSETEDHDPVAFMVQKQESQQFSYRPLISILTPVYKIDHRILKETIESVQGQSYDRWEMCVTYTADETEENIHFLEELGKRDPRFKCQRLHTNQGISDNTNACLKMAEGDFIAFLDHDDLITQNALFEMVKVMNRYPEVDFIYSDRDIIDQDSKEREAPLFKHAWSWVTMLSGNYAIHFSVIKRKLFETIGELRSKYDGAQDLDLFLRVSEATANIIHVPKVLYHWRKVPSSAASGIEAKPYVLDRQLAILNAYKSRRGLNCTIKRNKDGEIQVQWQLKARRRYHAIIYMDDGDDVARVGETLDALTRQYCKPSQVVILSSKAEAMPQALRDKYDHLNISWVSPAAEKIALTNLEILSDSNVNYLFILKAGVVFDDRKVSHDFIAWLEEAGYSGASGKILDHNGLIQNAGYVMTPQKELIEPYKKLLPGSGTTYGSANWYRQYLAVSECCFMVNREHVQQALFNWSIQAFNRESLLGLQHFICQAYETSMVYDPFILVEAPPLPPLKTVTRELQGADPYYHPAVWDWNSDVLKNNVMDRKKKLLSKVDVSQAMGVEIGPLMRPIVTKEEGRVFYVDHTTTDELMKKYADDPNVDVSMIETVDFVWGEKTLREAIPSHYQFDYVIASHVIEHVPDVIGWLNEMDDILKVGGKVCLAIPDKRYTFDYARRLTTAAEWIDAYLHQIRRPSPRQIFDFYAHAVHIDVKEAWESQVNLEQCEKFGSDEIAWDYCKKGMEEGAYVDVHCSVFTAESFCRLLRQLFQLNLLNFRVAKFYKPEPYTLEFIVILEKLPKFQDLDEKKRLQLQSLPAFENDEKADEEKGDDKQ